jgi:hypothetical protein
VISIRIVAPSGSGIPLAAYMSMALEAIPFDRQDAKIPPDNPPINAVVG